MIHGPRSLAALLAFLAASAITHGQQPQTRGVADSTLQSGQQAQRGAYYALVIGINGYSDFPALKTPRNDATEVAQVLKERYSFVTNLLLDATRDQILSALDDYSARLKENDSLLIYYAGHGWSDKTAGEAYWIPVDGQKDKRSHWITAADITDEARVVPARHVLIISDSCYSGMLAARDVSPTVGAPRERSVFLDKLLAGKSRNIMASGGDEPVSDSDAPGHNPNHSIFANALLQGLGQIGATAFSAKELFDQYVYGSVGGQSQQLPEYDPIRDSGHDNGDFIFFRSGSSPVSNPPPDRDTSPAAVPAVSAVSPNAGSATGGVNVTIQGSGFTGAKQVKFNSRLATSFTVVSDTQIDAVAPPFVNPANIPPAGLAAPVLVCSSAGCSPLNVRFTYRNSETAPQPELDSKTISVPLITDRKGRFLLTALMSDNWDGVALPPEIGQQNGGHAVRGFLSFDLSQIPEGSKVAHAELHCRIGGGSGSPMDPKFFSTVLIEQIPVQKNAWLTHDDFVRSGTLVNTISLADLQKPQDVTKAVAAALANGIITFRLRFAADHDNDPSTSKIVALDYGKSTFLQITLK